MRLAAYAVLLVSAAACSEQAAEEHVPWHVVLITVDSLRWDHLGAYGYRKDTSPFLDEFARSAVRFEQALAQWPETAPSIATLLSGTFPGTHGVTALRTRMDPRVQLLAERLRDAGYRTVAAVNASALGGDAGFRQGFDTFYEVSSRKETTGPPENGPLSEARRTTALALQGLDESDGGETFLWVHYGDPRAPYDVPDAQVERFREPEAEGSERTLPFRDPEQSPGKSWSIGCINDEVAIPGEQRIAEYVARYDAEIRAVDDEIRVLMEGLESRGLRGTALVVVAADHGVSLGEHDCYFASGMFAYEASCRVPLLLDHPGLEEPVVVPESVSLVDVAATIFHYLQLPVSDLDGGSLRPLIERTGDAPSPFVYVQAGKQGQPQCAVRAPRWKLLWVPEAADRRLMSGDEYELYDLSTDPMETRNLAAEKPEVVEVLRQRLEEHFRVGRRSRRAAEPSGGEAEATEAQAKERPQPPVRPPREGGRRGDGKR